jgi:hypothetical protein
MDWAGCQLVEVVPGKVAGKPVIKGTRILADTIVEDFELRRSNRGDPGKLSFPACRNDSPDSGIRAPATACSVKVLLDENLPHQLRSHLWPHETVTTVFAVGWTEKWRPS